VAAALYTPPPKESGGGFDIGAFVASQAIDVFPENWPVVELFVELSTQWRVGMSGATGLDYNVLFRLLDDRQLSRDERYVFFNDTRIMEATALETMHQSSD